MKPHPSGLLTFFLSFPSSRRLRFQGPLVMRENCVKSLALDKRIFSARVPSQAFQGRPRAGSWNCSTCGQLESKSYMETTTLKAFGKITVPGVTSLKNACFFLFSLRTHVDTTSYCLIHCLSISCSKQHFSGTLIAKQLLMSLWFFIH